ncbi:MAG: hypothetical protein ABIV51_09305 [Saprospiraceae bacterium]
MKFFTNIDATKAGKLLCPTYATFAGFPAASGSTGGVAYATDTNTLYWSNGTTWAAVGGTVGAMSFKGVVAFGATEPTSPVNGDTYLFSTAGANTWNTSDVVEVGDMAIWNGTNWSFVQTNLTIVAGTEAAVGILQLASVVEAIAGVNTAKAVTPEGLSGAIQANRCTSVDGTAGAVLTGDGTKTSFPVIHTGGANALIDVIETSGGNRVTVDVVKTSNTASNIVFAIAPAASPTFTVRVR